MALCGGRYEKLPSYELIPLVQEYAYAVSATYCLGAHIRAQTRIHTLTHARKHLYAHTIEMHTHIYAHAHSRTRTFARMHKHVLAQVCTIVGDLIAWACLP